MISQTASADLEIRILDKQTEGYPVEMTLNSEQEFPRGYLNPAFLPWVPSASPAAASERLLAWGLCLSLVRSLPLRRSSSPLEDPRTLEKSKLTMIGENLLGFQNDYFCDALLQEVSGTPDGRQKRALKSLEQVIATQQLNYFEYRMARCLAGKHRSQEK
jgi:hypothetical protein